MAITITLEIHRDLEFDAGFDEVFDLLADVPRSGAHFPKVDQLVDLGDNAYRWEMVKLGLDKHSIQTVYACKYASDREKGVISWVPVRGEGNSKVQGQWKITPVNDHKTRVEFTTEGEMNLPFPKLMKMAISPVVKHEFNSLVDTYMKNLRNAFAG